MASWSVQQLAALACVACLAVPATAAAVGASARRDGSVLVGDVLYTAEQWNGIMAKNSQGASARRDGFVSVGDVLYTAEQWNDIMTKNLISKAVLWPAENGIVHIPYRFTDPNVNKEQFELANDAWEKDTCIQFYELDASDTVTTEYLNVTLAAECEANMGRQEGRPSLIGVGGDCDFSGVVHELGHGLGMHHEHCRSDRDDNLIVVHDNVIPGVARNFLKANTINYGVPYDYTSIMQYADTAGSINTLRVMVTRDPRFQNILDQYKEPSFMNIKLANIMYGCADTWLEKCNRKTDPCKNGGYTKQDCDCACPIGTKGKTCQKLVMSYNDALIEKYSPYSVVITEPGSLVRTPGYPKAPSKGTTYTQVIRAPKCEKVVLTFTDFQVYKRNADGQSCGVDSLEIRSDVNNFQGQMFCGEELKEGQVFKSDKNELILHYRNYDWASKGRVNPSRGYSATFTTEADPEC